MHSHSVLKKCLYYLDNHTTHENLRLCLLSALSVLLMYVIHKEGIVKGLIKQAAE